MVENSPANTGDMRDAESVSGLGNPLEYEVVTHSSVLAWKSHGQRSLAGCSPWGRKESLAEQLSMHTQILC